jgi:hypothetical protein
MNDDYYCVLSGLSPQSIGEDEGDDFGDMPNGWLKITVQRRVENPKWQLIQQIKEASLEQMIAQIPEEARDESVSEALAIQIEAQYVAIEDRIGRYIVDEEVRYIADPAQSEAIQKETKTLFDKLELDFDDFSIEFDEPEEKEEEK